VSQLKAPPETVPTLTQEQRRRWKEDGFLVLGGALAAHEVESVLATIDDVVERRFAATTDSQALLEASHSVRIRHAVGETPEIARLLDHPSVFPYLLELIGPYLSLVGSEIFVRSGEEAPLVRFHTDGGPSLQRILVAEGSRAIQLKVQLFLTDVSQENSGNFVIVPGSHRQQVSETLPGCFIPEANRYLDEGSFPPGATQLLAKPGDAVVFHHSLWHAVAPNKSGRPRKSIIFRYGHLWHRPFDFDAIARDVLEQLTPRQRRLLGDIGPDPGPKDYYKPPEQLDLMLGTSAR
jgi:hypothetical protein